jgi:hypothetical protein
MSNEMTAAISVPAEVKRWNWGAFLMNWIWGLGNRTYIALLCLIPVVNLVMVFILGAKGGQWAWKNKHWAGLEQFTHTQRLWAAFGFGMLAGCLIMLIIFIAILTITFNNVFM